MRYFTWRQLLSIVDGSWERLEFIKTTGFTTLKQGAAACKDPTIMFEVGCLSLIGDPRISADPVVWFDAAADRDHAGAIAILGYLNEFGVKIDQNIDCAIQLYERAALLENVGAQYRLAYHLLRTHSATGEFHGFIRWCQKCALAGDSDGQLLYGFAFRDGVGVKRNTASAYEWIKRSAEAGNADALDALSEWVDYET